MRELARAGRRLQNSSTTPEEVLQTQVEPVDTGNQRDKGVRDSPALTSRVENNLATEAESS